MMPAVEATRIAPGPRPTPLLSSDKLPPAPTPRKRSRWPWLLVLLLLLAVGALAAFAIGGVPGDDSAAHDEHATTTTTQETTAVASQTLDDLVGQTYVEASATLAQLSGRRHAEGAARARRHARGQRRGRERCRRRARVLHDGDTVLLKVSRGQKNIPNVVGKTEAEARERARIRLHGARRAPRPATRSTRARSPARIPPVGTRVPVGSTVTIYVSTGPAAVQVPNLVGKTRGRGARRRSRRPG